MRGDEIVQLADGVCMKTEREARLDQLLDCCEVQLVEPRDLTLGELGVGDVRQRTPAPHGERALQRRNRFLRRTSGEASTSFVQQPREALDVQLTIGDLQYIATAARAKALAGPERLTQARDVSLERLRRGGRRVGAVEVVDQPVGRDHFARMEEQVRQQGALTRAAELDYPPAVLNLQLAEDSEVHLLCRNRL
jgi:hypothetical protein